MKRRVAAWAAVGFLVASCWVVYTFVTPPESLLINLRHPVVQAVFNLTCPISYFMLHYPISWRMFLLINAATYAVFGLVLEGFRLHSKSSLLA